MVIESSPIYDALVGELGNPVPAVPMDCSYQAAVAASLEAQLRPAEPVSLPAKRKPAMQKQMAAS
jgi:hypothetical protein